ncbi:MAG: aldose 1-epimerase family protein [Actinomycetota bacterium]|nr:aldose 1-epimerase family protein [Actinomycetota bacterium]
MLLRHGEYEAVVTPVAAGLRVLRHRGRDLVVSYEAGTVRPYYRGATVAPWPNRVVDGRYELAGTVHQLALTEPARGHALHGLVSWTRFDLVRHDERTAGWTHRIVPQVGYPFDVGLEVTYALGTGGLTWSVTARNHGQDPAPYGVCPHPYLTPGSGRVNDWELTLPASQVLEVTPDRLIPCGRSDVAESRYDFRAGRRIGADEVDHAFTGLGGGEVAVTVRGVDGRQVVLTWDADVLPWVQLHTADVPGSPQHRVGLALEPMTCPPDAFNSGADLVLLEPGQAHSASWAIGVG